MYLHPTSAAGRGDGTQGLDRAGLMQYGVVGGIITMYASYAVDFAVFERAAVRRSVYFISDSSYKIH